MGNYNDHYFKKDVVLLPDVLEKFTDTCLKFYKLDPCHYFNSPRLSWDVMLKMTRINLEKTLYIDMNLFIEQGLRGGMYDTCKKFTEAKNSNIKSHDPTKYITFLDESNL